MKKKNKKQSPATTCPVQDLGIRITPAEIFFTVEGEDKFRMKAADLIRLLDFKVAVDEVIEKKESPVFTLERFVLILRLLKKGLNFPQMQPIFELPINELKAGYERALNKFGDSTVVDQELVRQRRDGERDYVKKVPFVEGGQTRPGGEELVNLPGFRADLKQGSSLKEIAKTQHLDYPGLKDFYEKNEKYLKHLK